MDLASKTWLFSPSRHEREPYNSVEASQCRRFAILYLSDFAQTSDGRAGRGGGGCPGVLVSIRVSTAFRPDCTYDTVYAPPATHLPQDLQSQIPTALRLTETFPQNVHV